MPEHLDGVFGPSIRKLSEPRAFVCERHESDDVKAEETDGTDGENHQTPVESL